MERWGATGRAARCLLRSSRAESGVVETVAGWAACLGALAAVLETESRG